MRPTYSSYSMAENRICSGPAGSPPGAGMADRIVSNSGRMSSCMVSGVRPDIPSRADAYTTGKSSWSFDAPSSVTVRWPDGTEQSVQEPSGNDVLEIGKG